MQVKMDGSLNHTIKKNRIILIKMLRIRLLVFRALMVVFLIYSCSMFGQSTKGVTAQEFFEQHIDLLYDEETLIIDGRTDEMFAGGHIENAINIDADMENLEDELKKHIEVPRIVVYCTTSRRTYDIVYVLEKIYKGEIIYISDGITGWRANGFPEIND